MLQSPKHRRFSPFTLWAALTAGLLALSSATNADENPYLEPDDSWITLSGTVDSVSPDSFQLDYGEGVVRVEMDDGDRDADAYKLLKGDEVTVTGKIDDDMFEMTKIEASSLYVENISTTFISSSVDEEDYPVLESSIYVPLDLQSTVVSGTVTDVNGDEFTLDSESRRLDVDVSSLTYDPFDEEGYQEIEIGDRVKVFGEIDTDFFEGRELVADSIVELSSS